MTTIHLFNPYHDAMGRFAPSPATAYGIASSVVKRSLPGPLGKVVAGQAAAQLKRRGQEIDKQRLDEAEYKAKYQSLPGFAKDLLLNPAEAYSRKEDRHAKAARWAVEFGSDIAIRSAVRATLYGSASSVGSAATAAVLAGLLGTTAPAWAVTIGGAVAGISAYVVVSTILDHGSSQLLGAWVDSASPNDRHHIRLGGFGAFKRRQRNRGIMSAIELAPILIGGPISILGALGGEAVGIGLDAYNLIDAAQTTSQGLEVSQAEYEKNESARLLSAMLYPHVVDNLLYDNPGAVVLPIVHPRLTEFGFVGINDKMIMTKDSVMAFAENWNARTFPSVTDIGWGDTTLKINGEQYE